mmetsp:Transcript_7420/g.21071  ORF Transcript_7420/g.21071 Transcript_7420/m.21071 type:complete len:240 (-) Transcript_7420:2203-2922(-)
MSFTCHALPTASSSSKLLNGGCPPEKLSRIEKASAISGMNSSSKLKANSSSSSSKLQKTCAPAMSSANGLSGSASEAADHPDIDDVDRCSWAFAAALAAVAVAAALRATAAPRSLYAAVRVDAFAFKHLSAAPAVVAFFFACVRACSMAMLGALLNRCDMSAHQSCMDELPDLASTGCGVWLDASERKSMSSKIAPRHFQESQAMNIRSKRSKASVNATACSTPSSLSSASAAISCNSV